MPIDNESVIRALTSGIGAHLGRQALRSFFELESRLKRVPDYTQLDSRSQQLVVDLLALSVFYTTVISPLESSTELFSIANRAGATHIRIGEDKLTSTVALNMQRCVRGFTDVLRRTDVPIDLLSFSSLPRFVKRIVTVAAFKENEALGQ